MIDQARRLYPILPPALLQQSMETARVEKFHDGGREAMMALRALTLANGRIGQAKHILQSFAQQISQEMSSPCPMDLTGETECSSADGPLWYFDAVGQFLEYTGEYAFVRQHLYPVLTRIICWYVQGTHTGIKVDGCGLVTLGKPGLPLTWMNAEIDGRIVTPRHGKPVEIQALWYNALCIIENLARRFGDDCVANRFAGRAAVAHWSFNRLFWNSEKQCLYDVVHTGTRDSAIRPNQILAVGLRYSILPEDRARRVLEVVQRELLTPFGLRTLAPADPQYLGRCEGSSRQGACAYYQGSVWLWLISPFTEAYLKINRYSQAACEQMYDALSFLEQYLADWPAGHTLPHVFDGDFPHTPRASRPGAWITAEVHRVMTEIMPLQDGQALVPRAMSAIAG